MFDFTSKKDLICGLFRSVKRLAKKKSCKKILAKNRPNNCTTLLLHRGRKNHKKAAQNP